MRRRSPANPKPIHGENMLKNFEKLAQIPGGSGFEEEVIEFIATELKRRLPDVSVDPMGNVIGKLGKGKKSVMVCVHSDEVGTAGQIYRSERVYLF